jgi:hypothetical protein
MPKLTRAQCEAKGFTWNEDKQTCTIPKITLIKMSISRGPGCDGSSSVLTIRKPLPLAVREALLKAGRQKKRPRSSR